MFDLSWSELLFVAVLALLVVGPRELPGLARTIGGSVQKGRRLYRDAMNGVTRLEQEIDAASHPEKAQGERGELLPEEVREAMRITSPHGDAQAHRDAEAAWSKALDERSGQGERETEQ